MNITRENIDDLNSVIKLTIEKADYEKRVADVLKSYQKKANMPGFRPGKVPAGMIRKMYGTSVLVDEINKLVSENLSNYLSENELEILGEPLPSESQTTIDFEAQEDFEFSFDIALAPVLDIKLTKREKLPYYQIEITDEMLNDHIESQIARFGSTEKVDTVGENSLVKGDFAQLGEDGLPLENGIVAEDSVLSIAIIKDDSEKSKLLSASVGSEIVFDPKLAFPNDTEITYLLKVDKEVAATLTGNFKFTIKEITEQVKPELNSELFDKVYGEGEVTTEEEFKARMKADLAKTFEMESEYRFSFDAREKLVGKVACDLPEAFLRRWMKATAKDKDSVTDEKLDADMPGFMEDLKWQLVKNEIIKSQELKIEEQDVVNFAKKSARAQFMQYGLTNLPDEHIERYAVDMMKDQNQGRRFAEGAISEKVIEYVKEAVKIDEKVISRKEFNALFEGQ